jgi:hypothetical protein
MAELPELRTIANSNGGSTTMRSNSQRSKFLAGAPVRSRDTFFSQERPCREAAKAFDPDSERQELSSGGRGAADSRATRWASLQPNDREVFNIWAKWVIAFYSLLVAGLVVAMLLGARTSADRKDLSASSTAERGPPALSATAPGSMGK